MVRMHNHVICAALAVFFLSVKSEGQTIHDNDPFTVDTSQRFNFLDKHSTYAESYNLSTLLQNGGKSENETDERHPNLNLFGNFGKNILNSFAGNKLYYHLGAIAATAVLAPTDLDYTVQHYFQAHPQYYNISLPVQFTGQYLPFIVGGGLFALSKLENNDEVLGASYAVLQSSLIGLMYMLTLKAITGRSGPLWWQRHNMEDLSKMFKPGFLRGGVDYGWPSGHTVATMAVVSALTSYYPDKTWLKIVGYGVVGYTMFAVTATNDGGFHWFSDVVAGALMSYAIGSTVGSYFRDVYSGRIAESSSKINLSPTLIPPGISLLFQF